MATDKNSNKNDAFTYTVWSLVKGYQILLLTELFEFYFMCWSPIWIYFIIFDKNFCNWMSFHTISSTFKTNVIFHQALKTYLKSNFVDLSPEVWIANHYIQIEIRKPRQNVTGGPNRVVRATAPQHQVGVKTFSGFESRLDQKDPRIRPPRKQSLRCARQRHQEEETSPPRQRHPILAI